MPPGTPPPDLPPPGDPVAPPLPGDPAAPRFPRDPAAPPRPLPTIARDLVDDVRTLVSQEVALAKAEVTRTVTRAVKAAVAFATAAVLALYLLGFLLGTIARALEGPLPDWAAWGITTLLIAVAIVALAVLGRSLLPSGSPVTAARDELDATRETVQRRLGDAQEAFATAARRRPLDD